MTTVTEDNTLGDLLLVEVKPGWTKQKGVIDAGNLALGAVLAKVAGKYSQVDFGGAGGAEVAVAVLAEPVDATLADKPGIVIARGAVVNVAALAWPVGATDPQKAAAIAQLDALGIVAVTAL